MFKKILLILAGVVLAIGVLGVAGYVYAQADDPTDTVADRPFGKRDIGFDLDHWFGWGGEDGIMHEYLFPAFAKVFGLGDDQVQAFEVVRETMQNIRDKFTAEEIRTKMQEAFSSALDEAVADGAITQDEADRMLERRQSMGGMRFPGGPGGRGGGGRMPMGGMDFDGREGFLSGYIESALADAMGVSADELQAMKAEGLNLADYAEEQGMTVTELQDFMKGVYTSAVDAALEDGVITQEQADDLLTRIENSNGRMPWGPMPGGRGW